jgi:hypothetical protein
VAQSNAKEPFSAPSANPSASSALKQGGRNFKCVCLDFHGRQVVRRPPQQWVQQRRAVSRLFSRGAMRMCWSVLNLFRVTAAGSTRVSPWRRYFLPLLEPKTVLLSATSSLRHVKTVSTKVEMPLSRAFMLWFLEIMPFRRRRRPVKCIAGRQIHERRRGHDGVSPAHWQVFGIITSLNPLMPLTASGSFW